MYKAVVLALFAFATVAHAGLIAPVVHPVGFGGVSYTQRVQGYGPVYGVAHAVPVAPIVPVAKVAVAPAVVGVGHVGLGHVGFGHVGLAAAPVLGAGFLH